MFALPLTSTVPADNLYTCYDSQCVQETLLLWTILVIHNNTYIEYVISGGVQPVTFEQWLK